MQNIKCKACDREIAFDDLVSSLAKYGFINLISDDDEIVGFYCPHGGCREQIFLFQQSGELETFYTIADSLKVDVRRSSGYQNYAPFNFSEKSVAILRKYKSLELETSFIPNRKEWLKNSEFFDNTLSDKYYCSLNWRCLDNIIGKQKCYLYPKEHIKTLLDLEAETKERLFPRYMTRSFGNQKIDKLFLDKFYKEAVLEDLQQGSNTRYRSGNWRKDLIVEQLDFLEILTDDGWWLTDEIPENIQKASEKNIYIWKNYHNEATQKQLAVQFEQFRNDYFTLYSKIHFNSQDVRELAAVPGQSHLLVQV